MRILPRKNIRDLKPYEPGKPIEELERELGIRRGEIIKLASNENPIGPSPRAIRAVREALMGINRYPDGSGFYLKRRLASALRLKPENIVLGNGSDELIDIITKTFLEEDDEVIISAPSFLEYKIIVKTRGAKIREVPMTGPSFLKGSRNKKAFGYDINRILKSITKKTRLIFLGNPDNPTGAYLTKGELSLLLKNCPKRVTLVFDEAYRELVQGVDYANPQGYLSRYNIIILRTFSKAYGLAGLRVGYAVAANDLAGWMERARQPFNVNLLAQVAAEAAIDDKRHLSRTNALIKKGKRFLVSNLIRFGFEVIESPANFILFSCKGIKGSKLFKELLYKGIIVRDMKAYGLIEWVRVNVGTMPENRRFIEAIEEVRR